MNGFYNPVENKVSVGMLVCRSFYRFSTNVVRLIHLFILYWFASNSRICHSYIVTKHFIEVAPRV